MHKLPQLIEQIYEALLGPDDAWTAFLTSLRDAVGGCQAALYIQSLGSAQSRMISLGDPGYDRSYREHYGGVNPWFTRGKHLIRPGAVVTSEWYPSDQLRRSEFYADWLKPQGMFYAVNGFVFAGRQFAANVAVAKPWAQDGPQAEDLQLVRSLMPHLKCALEIQRRTALGDVDRASSLCGLLYVDENSKILYSNATAQRLMDGHNGLTLGSRGELRAVDAAEDARLRRLIVRAMATARAGWGAAADTLPINAPGTRHRLAVTVSPLRTKWLAFDGEPVAALVVVHDPESRARPNAELLSVLYGLTPREAELAAALALGKSLDEASAEMRIGREAARTHLRHVMAKTDTHRQSELLRLLLVGCPLEQAGGLGTNSRRRETRD